MFQVLSASPKVNIYIFFFEHITYSINDYSNVTAVKNLLY